jgi:hypothetical protein
MLKEFKKIIGNPSYSVFINQLRVIGSDARTHRICVVIAAMLRFALEKVYREGQASAPAIPRETTLITAT